MQRVTLLTLLVSAVLCAGSLAAQQRGGVLHGSGSRVGNGPVVTGPHIGRHCCFHHFHRSGAVLGPFWYGEAPEYDTFSSEVPASQPAPSIVIVQPPNQAANAPVVPAADAKVIEFPGVLPPTKPRPPAVFVLVNGQQLEAQRFVVTAMTLYVTIGREQRAIPLTMVELNATLAANRERGLQLRIPITRNEIFVAF